MNASPRVVCITAMGRGYGKTTLIEGITRLLREKGIKVCVVKHTAHMIGGESGKDTSRFKEAGALVSAILSTDGDGVVYLSKLTLDKMISLLSHLGPDLILCEGFKKSPYPKLVIVKGSEELAQLDSLEGIIGVISDRITSEGGFPLLKKEPKAVTDFILNYIWRG
ncbi:MAG: molybdopterin-guanine dinucleotide biosynthesis protein B [Candidatus Methanomethylicaceae archaeon]